jgi:hypothetical protein
MSLETSPPSLVENEPHLAAELGDLRSHLLNGPRVGYQARLATLQQLSDSLLRKGPALSSRMSHVGLPFLTGFLRQENLDHLVRREVSNPAALERFVPVGERKSLRIVPKGLVCHWIAGNVPLLGLFSWAISALVGNVNLIRLSSKQEDFVTPLLKELELLSDAGGQMVAETRVIVFDRQDLSAHHEMSKAADVRIAWGGEEAITAIQTLPRRWDCEDVILGPRVSFAVVDPELATDSVVTRLATDVVYFDQLACSSPQNLFVKGRPGQEAFDSFVDRFSAAFDRLSRAVARHTLSFSETYRVQLDRTRILLEGGSLKHDSHTQWTIALMEQPHKRVANANRFLQVVPFEHFEFICSQFPPNVQTVTTLLYREEFERFTELAALCGVCRFPGPGEGNHFEIPWDGIPLVGRLTRWVLRTDPRPT